MSIPTYRVTVLRFGATFPDMSALIRMREPGKEQEAPIHGLAIDGNGKHILVDTGLPDPRWVRDNFGKVRRDEDETVEAQLRTFPGWSLQDVDLVINTHLHFDHAGGNELFPHARFIVTRREYDYACSPETVEWAAIYPPHTFDRNAVKYHQWQFVEGDYEVMPGITLFPTPGHSIGHQSVAINTDEGTVVYAGDAISRMESLYERIPPGLYLNYSDAVASIDKIRAIADFVIPGHHDVVQPGQSAGFPRGIH